MYSLGPKKISPFTCPGMLLFIDYICLLCCFSNWCQHDFCMVSAVFKATPPLSGGQALCRARHSRPLGPASVRVVRDCPGGAPGGRRHRLVGLLISGCSGTFRLVLVLPGRPWGHPGWHECGHVVAFGVVLRTLLVRGDPGQPRGVARGGSGFYRRGAR